MLCATIPPVSDWRQTTVYHHPDCFAGVPPWYTAWLATRQEVAAARQMDAEEITAETGPFRATAPGRAKAAARVAAAQVARSSSSSSSRNVYDAHLESAIAVAWWSGDTEEEAATEQPPELREL